MNIVSCDVCGIVLDRDKLEFPDNIYRDDGVTIDPCKAARNSNGLYVPTAACPLCDADVLTSDGFSQIRTPK